MNLTNDELMEISACLVAAILREREARKQHEDYGRHADAEECRRRATVLADALGKVSDEIERRRPPPPKAA